ncbi:MAG: hypothetical protein K8W52_06405 [Deltaproteobacteria bacterium]|nr:hypothetical protein [Deltaproteobacteria bacterium]
MGVGRALIAAAILGLAAPAMADPLIARKGAVAIDWGRGVITARGVGPADRHAPAPAVARDAARLRAEDAAHAALAAAAKALAPGADAAAIDRAVARARIEAIDLGTDGSVTLTAALPLEAVRVAQAGPRQVGHDGEPAAPTIVIDARKQKLAPHLGATVTAGGGPWAGAVVWATALPKPGDPRLGDGARTAVATAATADGVTIAGPAPAPGALVIVVIAGAARPDAP